MGPVFQALGGFLLILVVVTGPFSSVLASLAPLRCAGVYAGSVMSLTAFVTPVAVARARALR
jgi:hypothetical protein